MHIKTLRLFIAAVLFLACLQSYGQYVWRHRACFPGAARNGATPFAIGDNFYLVGGCPFNENAIAEVWQYDEVTDSWSQKNNFPTTIFGGSAFVINDTAYVGFGCPNADGQPYYSAFYRYDQSNDQWIPIASFPGTPRYLAMSFMLQGQGYIISGKSVGFLTDTWVYNPVSDSWTQMTDFPGAGREAALGIASGNMGYVGEGRSANVSLYTDNYQYNANTNMWAQIANFPATERWGLGYFALNDTLYMAGGNNDTIALSDCWRYDLVSNSWVQTGGFSCLEPGGQSPYQGVSINGHGYIYGGGIIGGLANDLLEFGPVDTGFTQQVNVLGSDTSYCGSFNHQLTVSDSCAVWSTGEVGSQISVSTPGTYWVRMNDSCGVSSDTIVIAQTILPIGDSVQNASCGASNGLIGVYTLGGVSPFTFSWSNGDTTDIISNLDAGQYSVTVTDSINCSSTLTSIINTTNIGNVTISADTTSFCAGSGTLVCAPAGFTSYLWNTGQTTDCVYAQEAGNYYVTVSDGGNCSAESNHILLSVLPAPSVTISVRGDTLTCYNAASYQWYLNDTLIPGATDSEYIATQPGTYSVAIRGSNGCSITSNGQIINTTGITDLENALGLKLYPDPATNQLNILYMLNEATTLQIQITDLTGRTVNSVLNEKELSGNYIRHIDISQLASGVYILNFMTDNGIANLRFVKE